MKKILVVLMILSVAGGVFAQEGSWSVGGSAEMATNMNFHSGYGDDDDQKALIGGHAYNRYGWYGDITGNVDLNYNRGGFNGWIGLNNADGITFGATYDGGNYMFQAESSFMNLIAAENDPGRLWGYYKLLDDLLHLEVAFNSRDTNFWISSEVVGEVFAKDELLDNRDWGIGWGFASVDHHTYLLMDFNLESIAGMPINLGFMLPGVFLRTGHHGNGTGGAAIGDGPGEWWSTNPAGYHPSMTDDYQTSLLKSTFKSMILGFKADISGIEAALQYNLGARALYFGAKMGIDNISIGLSAELYLKYEDEDWGAKRDDMNGAFGLKVGFGDGPLGASLGLGLRFYGEENKGAILGFNPNVTYMLFDQNIRIQLDAGFWMDMQEGLEDKVSFTFMPELMWNLTGAPWCYWCVGTGFIFRYKFASWYGTTIFNAFDVTFKFSF